MYTLEWLWNYKHGSYFKERNYGSLKSLQQYVRRNKVTIYKIKYKEEYMTMIGQELISIDYLLKRLNDIKQGGDLFEYI